MTWKVEHQRRSLQVSEESALARLAQQERRTVLL